MILAIDVGNTNTVLGVFDGEELLADYRVSTERQRTADEWGMLLLELLDHAKIDGAAISGVIISSVVPPIITELAKMSRRYFRYDPEVVGPGMKTGISIRYENPKEVGADRIVNAVAGYELYGGPLIIVDFGTATTFCAIGQTGDYLGGAIAPGIMISAEALYMRAARLPRVELTKPQSVIGKNTVSSMQAGILYGFVGQVDEIVRRIKQELGGDPKVIATGGLAEVISLESDHIDEVNQNLTLIGLRILWERNHS
jgi:type III pantothenate kinase